MKYGDWYLDLVEVQKIKNESYRQTIHNYYRDMLHGNGNKDASESIFNTLCQAGYLKNITQEIRESKINQVLNED